jgi:hypothetical protein
VEVEEKRRSRLVGIENLQDNQLDGPQQRITDHQGAMREPLATVSKQC